MFQLFFRYSPGSQCERLRLRRLSFSHWHIINLIYTVDHPLRLSAKNHVTSFAAWQQQQQQQQQLQHTQNNSNNILKITTTATTTATKAPTTCTQQQQQQHGQKVKARKGIFDCGSLMKTGYPSFSSFVGWPWHFLFSLCMPKGVH